MENNPFNLISVAEWAKKYGYEAPYVRQMLISGRLQGGFKIGKQWVIPADTEPPVDNRVKSGNYRNWRKSKTE